MGKKGKTEVREDSREIISMAKARNIKSSHSCGIKKWGETWEYFGVKIAEFCDHLYLPMRER